MKRDSNTFHNREKEMANKSKKYCSAFPCNQVAIGGAYCLQHQPTPAEKTTEPFYLTVQWRRFRDYYIGLHPLCEQCLIEGRETSAQMVDHVVELKDGGNATDEANAMACCWKCHGIKTAAQARNRGKNHQLPYADNRHGNLGETY